MSEPDNDFRKVQALERIADALEKIVYPDHWPPMKEMRPDFAERLAERAHRNRNKANPQK